ncbi:MAG: mechanosensitive ion channel protein MscS [Gammaproteobacteria bacterium RIFCSPLOWO2_02_FULL_61_13]|nr:MAG: mechanosensitive ion channel protein MscS [Gammaproteobacteria bacterium RIFCSPLOWO2_02_FULL_61_13]
MATATVDTDMQTLRRLVDVSTELAVNYGFQAFGAVIILVVGWYASRWVGKIVGAFCDRSHMDVTLARFFANLARTVVLLFVVIIALGKFGITIAPFIAALGAVAFGGTLALQAPLSNYGAGLSIILTRPFVVGDTIRVAGIIGVVEDIRLAHTQLSSEDGETITIPNKDIVGKIIHNSFGNLAVEAVVSVDYDADLDKAIALIRGAIAACREVPGKPAPNVGIQRFGDSGIEIGYRYWVPTRRYYELMFDVNGRILTAFRASGIHISFPRREVRMLPAG